MSLATTIGPAKVRPAPDRIGPIALFRTIVRNPIETLPRGVYEERSVRTRAFGRDVTFLVAPDLIRRMLVDEAERFTKAETMRRTLGPVLGDAILTADGERWRWQRRTAAPPFRHDRIPGFVPAMIAAAEATRERWLSQPPGREVEVAHEMMRTTFDIIVETMLSGRGGIDVAGIERAVTDYLDQSGWIAAMTLLGLPRWVPYPGVGRARRARDRLHREVARTIAARRAADVPYQDLLALLMEARDPETGRAMDDRDIADNLLTFILAGHETTALALTWAFYLLALHPPVEAAVRREIAEVTEGRALAPEHIERLGLTRRVIQEAMRLYPPAPIIVRTAAEDVALGEVVIARGSNVYVPIYALHRHKALWDDPDRFDPDRFLPDAAKARDRYAYLPFGAGPRICIGMSFALVEATTVLAAILRDVGLTLRPGHVPELRSRVTLRPADGMPMTVWPV
jgi:cytochrome P450